MEKAMPVSQKEQSKILVWAAVIVIVVVGIWWFVSREDVQVLESGDRLTTAREGRVVRGFPQELLLERDAAVSESYSIAYTEGDVNQPVVRYLSSRTLAENVTMYGEYLRANDWEIIQDADPEESPATFFYAFRGWAQVNITFSEEQGGGVLVNIAYISGAAPAAQ